MWKKDGKRFINPLVLDGRLIFNPTAAQLLAAGYRKETPTQYSAPQAARYSSLKIIRALGAQWETVRAKLEEAGYLDQFLSANYIRADDPAFQLFLDGVEPELLAELDKCRWTPN